MTSTKCSPRRRSRTYTSPAEVGNEELKFSTDINNYELGEPIGYGSSAVVHVGKYIPHNKVVAIKVFDLDSFERNHIDELRKEIQIMSLSKHPNLLPVYGSLVHELKLYIFMPLLRGGSCLDIMRTAHPHGFDEPTIGAILLQGLEGLSYLHRNGLIHRDIKAGNLLVGEDGVVQLADFGVSSSLMEGGERKGLRKTFAGTPCWMAPEVMEQSGYGFKADIWSLGITALELANGRAPFAKYPPMKILMLTLKRDPPTLDRSTTKHKFSKTFKEMIDYCLAKDPVRRPPPEKLLQHSFFKQATKRNVSLVNTLLKGLPPITERIHKYQPPSFKKDSPDNVFWDFESIPGTPVEEFVQPPDDPAPVTPPSKSDPQEVTQKLEYLPQNQMSLKKSRFIIDMNIASSAINYGPQPVFPPPQTRMSISQTTQKTHDPAHDSHHQEASISRDVNPKQNESTEHIHSNQMSASENIAPQQQHTVYELRKGRFCVNSNTQVLQSPPQNFHNDHDQLPPPNKYTSEDTHPQDAPSLISLYVPKKDYTDPGYNVSILDNNPHQPSNPEQSQGDTPPLPPHPAASLNRKFKVTLAEPPIHQLSTNSTFCTGVTAAVNRRGRFEVTKNADISRKSPLISVRNIDDTHVPAPSANDESPEPPSPSDIVDLSRHVVSSTTNLCEKVQNLARENSDLINLVHSLVNSLHKLGKSTDEIKASAPEVHHPLIDKICSSLDYLPPDRSLP